MDIAIKSSIFGSDSSPVFERAVNALETLLVQQVHDSQHRAKMDALNNKHYKIIKNLNSKERNLQRNNLKYQFNIEKLRLLVYLIGKRGLSYVSEETVLVEPPKKKAKPTKVAPNKASGWGKKRKYG